MYGDSEDSPFDDIGSTEQVAHMRAEVREEFTFRASCIEANRYHAVKIHHFNWLGNPVFEYSATPPDVSLMYLLSRPKVLSSSDELRILSILARATVFIDPVIVYLPPRWRLRDLVMKPSNLVRSMTRDRVYKFYSQHGEWVDDEREWDENTAIDVGNVYMYNSPHTAFGNGFVEYNTIRSRAQWAQWHRELCHFFRSGHRKKAVSRIQNRPSNPSPLKFSMTLDDLDRQIPYSSEDDTDVDASTTDDFSPLEKTVRKWSFDHAFHSAVADEVSNDLFRPALEPTQPWSAPAYEPTLDVFPWSGDGPRNEQPLTETSQEIDRRRLSKGAASFSTAMSRALRHFERKSKSEMPRIQRDTHDISQDMQDPAEKRRRRRKRGWQRLSLKRVRSWSSFH